MRSLEIISGLSIDTLGSQVFSSGLDPQGLGVILQRAYMILTLFYIPVAILWWCSRPVFVALGQEDYISEWSCRFLRTLIPGGLGYILFETTKKYLQAQGLCPTSQNTDSRNHACIQLCSYHHLPNQHCLELSLRIYLQIRSSWSTRSNRNYILAILLPLNPLREIRRGRRPMGRMVKTCFPRMVNIYTIGTYGNINGWN